MLNFSKYLKPLIEIHIVLVDLSLCVCVCLYYILLLFLPSKCGNFNKELICKKAPE